MNLLDLPMPWLSQMALTQLDSRSKKCLSRTCKFFRDLYLEQADAVQCSYTYVSGCVSAAKAATSLQLLTRCKDAANIKLWLKDYHARPLQDYHTRRLGRAKANFTNWLRRLCSHASMVPGFPLHHVTCLELQGHVLGNIVPVELATLCPKMRHFIRWGNFCTLAADGYAPVECPQLQQLTVRHLCGVYPESDQITLSLEQLEQQLQNLPNLKHVEFSFDYDLSHEHERFMMDGIKTLSKQVTSLLMDGSSLWQGVPTLMASIWPHLGVLRLPQCNMRDMHELQVLLEHAPLLYELEVHHVPSTTIPLPCNNLRLLRVAEVCVGTLVGFPLVGLHEFRFTELFIEATYAQQSEQQFQAAAAMLASTMTSTGTDSNLGALCMHVDSREGPATGDFASLLRCIPHQSITLRSVHLLDDKWLQLLADLDCKHLIVAPQALSQSTWDTLLHKLPQLQTLELLFLRELRTNWALLGLGIQLCTFLATLPRPLTLLVHSELGSYMGAGWQLSLDKFLQACSRRHATITAV